MYEENQNENSFTTSDMQPEPVVTPDDKVETTEAVTAAETVETVQVTDTVETIQNEASAVSQEPQSEPQTNTSTYNVPPQNANSFNGNGSFPPPPTYTSYQFGQQQPFGQPLTPPPQQKPPKQPKKKGIGSKIALTACLALLFGVIAGGVIFGMSIIKENLFDDESAPTSFHEYLEKEKTDEAESVSVKNYTEIVTDVSQVVEDVMPSVVSITTISTSEYSNFFGYSFPQQSESTGSGVIVGSNDTELLIVTNNHVISGATSLTVTFADEEIAEAQVKGTDASMDLAVIAVPLNSIKESTMSSIAIAEIGDSTSLKVGEPAIAIGNALGYGQSVTCGIISAIDREVTVDNVTNKLIQTDAAINPGNSGGALLNVEGQLIGINSVKYSSTEVEGMGYAIPISSAMPIIEKLMDRETKSKVEGESGYLGIAGATVTENASHIYNLPAGVFVSEVIDGYGAEQGGLKSGDIIIEVEGTTITSMESLQSELEYYAPGETITVVVMTQTNSGYAEKELHITLSQKPEE